MGVPVSNLVLKIKEISERMGVSPEIYVSAILICGCSILVYLIVLAQLIIRDWGE